MFENVVSPGLICQKKERKKTQVNFVNKNAGLKERSASKPTVSPEEAEPYPWLEDQVPEDSGKLSSTSDQMCFRLPAVPPAVSRRLLYP